MNKNLFDEGCQLNTIYANINQLAFYLSNTKGFDESNVLNEILDDWYHERFDVFGLSWLLTWDEKW